MIATRFREVVWTGGICAAALVFYMVSQTVASKRAELEDVEKQIARTNQQIRELRTEIDTRGGLAQIERWNDQVYGLKAPGAEQFVSSSIKLAALAQPQGRPALQLDPAIVASHGALSKVSLDVIEDRAMGAQATKETQASMSPPVARPAIRQASYIQAKPSAMAPSAPSPVHEAAHRKPVSTALDADFLEGIGEEASTGHSRKVKP